MTYDIDARLREIAKEECRVRRWRKRLVALAILTGAFLCGMVAAAARAAWL
jgi:hypothetical protein